MPPDEPSDLGAKRNRTRARLIEAAAELFAARSFHGATLADVAQHAGMTTGAIYGNFKGKEDLFLAIFEKPAAGVGAFVRFREGAALKEQMRRLGEGVVAFLPTAKARGALFAEFQLYVQTHPDMQARIDARTLAAAGQLAQEWRIYFDPREVGMALEQFVVVIDALIDGLVAQWLLTPSVVSEDTILKAFEALA